MSGSDDPPENESVSRVNRSPASARPENEATSPSLMAPEYINTLLLLVVFENASCASPWVMPKSRHENRCGAPVEELPALAMRDGTTGAGVGKDKATGPKARQIV